MGATIFNFGSINIDHIYRVPHFVSPGETLASTSLDTVLGGKGANQSVALARAGAKVKHIGRACKSDQWVFTYLEACGVDISNIERVDNATGHAIIQVDEHGENAIVLHGGANHGFESEFLEQSMSSCDVGDYLLAQNECNALPAVISLALSKGLRVVLNPAPMTDSIKSLPLDLLDTLIVNQGEAQALVGDSGKSGEQALEQMISALSRMLPNTRVVVTLGSDGAVLLSKGSVSKVAAVPAKVIDTTAAGDTFVGYFLAGLIDGLPEGKALNRACAAGALAVESLGAIPSIPTRDQLESKTSN